MPIRLLHHHLYQNGAVGMCNVLMSAEIAVAIGVLTARIPHLYAESALFNSAKGYFLDDLFDLDGLALHRRALATSGTLLPVRLQETCLTYGVAPSAAFLCGRTRRIDLQAYDAAAEISTADDLTLGFYSYLFCLSASQQAAVDHAIARSIRPKQRFQECAAQIVATLQCRFGAFNSICVRRGDYLRVNGTCGARINASDFIDVLRTRFSADQLLLIHSDETDPAYFAPIKQAFPQMVMVDSALAKLFDDPAELGLVSMLIASRSEQFIGTMYSTFSEFIRRYRMQNGLPENFVYLYSQHERLALSDGCMLEKRAGENRWNRIDMPPEMYPNNFWWREWYQPPAQIRPTLSMSC